MQGLPIEERQMVVDLIHKLRQRLLPQDKILEFDEAETFPESIIRELLGPDIGLQFVFIPEEFGGMGGGARDIAIVSEELSRICLGISTAFLAIHLGADPLIIGGTADQKAKWLGKIADEGCIVAYAVTEPEAGSNLANLKTRAVPIRDSEGRITTWEISGSKQFISNGGFADFLTVLADTDEGPTFFVVEKSMPGFKPGKPENKHGIRCSNTSPLVFDKVRVPAENLIGGIPGQGLKQANAVFGYTRLMVAAFGLGAGVEALHRAIRYARERIQFGSPLIEKPGYTHKLLVPNWVNLEAARAYIESISEQIDQGMEDCEVEGSIAKYFATEAGNRAAEEAIQAFGGYGYMKEYEIEKIKRDVRITTIYEGTSEIQQMIIGTYRWRNSVRSKGGFYNALAEQLDALNEPSSDGSAACIAGAVRAVNRLILEVHAARLTRHQHVLFSLADMITYVEVGAALVRKAALVRNPASVSSRRLRLSARIFTASILPQIRAMAEQVILGTNAVSDDDADSILSQLALDTRKANRAIIQDMDELVTLL
ncbi:acyl-CoA dehydrogenase family protein [bacterium]|nr:acyl-CoA dehydrogenase family protein [candidate division CSSED10-310 bacterium]